MSTILRFLFFLLHLFLTDTLAATFTVTNNCDYTVWPGILSSAGASPLRTTGFALSKGESQPVAVPTSWSGRLWARTLCSADPTGRFTCATGDCGSSGVQCAGNGAAPPATLAEFTLNGSGGLDFYDVSLVDGYNLPMLVTPRRRGCSSTGCLTDLNPLCPSELKVAGACKSACEAFGSPEYCCNGEYGSPNTCKPSSYSMLFKSACPRAYSYAYDDATSTFTCGGAGDYAITFCPVASASRGQSGNFSGNDPEALGLPLVNQTMVFISGDRVSSSALPDASPIAIAFCFVLLLAFHILRH